MANRPPSVLSNASTVIAAERIKSPSSRILEKRNIERTYVQPVQQRSKRRLQNFFLIWLDSNINMSDPDFKHSLEHLRSIVITLELYTNVDECIEYMKTISHEKLFLIVSGAIGEKIVPVIHDLNQLDTIFIFCANKDRHKTWAKRWPKIKRVSPSIKHICESLKIVAHQCDHDETSMSLVPKQASSTAADVNEKNLRKLGPAYIYTMLFKDILMDIDEDDDQRIQDLIVYCRENDVPDSELANFKKKYHQKTPIWWYTSEIFLYGMLNRALREPNIEAMTKLGFFIRHLHQQLISLHKEQSSQFDEEFIVYRGQGLPIENFKDLQDAKGGLVAFNNFLSTSAERNIAATFIEENLKKYEKHVGVLFIIKFVRTKAVSRSTSFAIIDKYSANPREHEVLFSMHTVFRIGRIRQSANDQRLWEVKLTLTDDDDPELTGLILYMKNEFSSVGWYRMAELMIKMGDFVQAEALYNQLLMGASNDNDRAKIYHMLGLMKNNQAQYEQAVTFYRKSLEMKRKSVKEDDPSLSASYSVIGAAFVKMGNYSGALEFLLKALVIKRKILQANHPDLATLYNSIGLTFNHLGNSVKALEFLTMAVNIREKALPSTHPDLATSYNYIGLAHNNSGNYKKAVAYYEKALQIREKVLLPTHPDLATSYNNIGMAYSNMGEFAKAFEFYKKALNIQENSLPSLHPDIATCNDNMGLTYHRMKKHLEALEFYEKARKIREQILPPFHPDVAASYNNIGLTYSEIGNYTKALWFLEKAFVILQKSIPATHPHIKLALDNIKSVRSKMTK